MWPLVVCLALTSFPVTSPLPVWGWPLPAVALVLYPRVGEFTYVLRLCGPFKQSCLKIRQILPLPQSPLAFIARSYGDLSSQCWNPGLCSLSWGWDRLLPRCPSQVLSTTCECKTIHAILPQAPFHAQLHLCTSLPISVTPPLLPLWMNVASWWLDFHTF